MPTIRDGNPSVRSTSRVELATKARARPTGDGNHSIKALDTRSPRE